MSTRCLYPANGGGSAAYYVSDGVVYEMDGAPAFYINGDTVFAFDGGKAVYWISNNYLFEHGTGQARFYFSD